MLSLLRPNPGRISSVVNIKDHSWQVVFNEKAGRLTATKGRANLVKLLQDCELEYNLVSEMEKLAVSLSDLISKGHKHFIIAGGDGSLNYFVNALAANKSNLDVKLNILPFPLGSGNDYCKSLNIKSVKKYIENDGKLSFENVSLATILHSSKVEYYINVAGMGFDAETLRFYDKIKSFKAIRGSAGFIMALLVVLFKFKSKPVIMKCDDRKISIKLYTVLIGMGKYLGGGLYMCPHADPRFKALSVTIIKHVSILKILRNVAKLFNGKIGLVEEVELLRCNKVEIISSELISQADGEIIEAPIKTLEIQKSNLYFPFIS